MRKALIGTGLYDASGSSHFFEEWINNLRQTSPLSSDITISQVVCICNGGTWPILLSSNQAKISFLQIDGNLGHVGDLMNGTKPYECCGWSAVLMALALLAYNDESDLIYKEQDCLAFGPWINQMYEDMGDGHMAFGRKMTSPPWMECGQSLILIRHKFIPAFISAYINLGPDRLTLPETKFARFESMFPSQIKRLSFGYDRERPLNMDDRVWYAQKFTEQELQQLKQKGLT